MFGWTIGVVLLAGTIAGVMTAAAQKTAANPSAGKQWLAAMDTDKDGTVSKQEFRAYMEAGSTRRMLITMGLLMETS
jgi:hypothetical protein